VEAESAVRKLDALIEPLANGEATLDVRYHETDPGFMPIQTPPLADEENTHAATPKKRRFRCAKHRLKVEASGISQAGTGVFAGAPIAPRVPVAYYHGRPAASPPSVADFQRTVRIRNDRSIIGWSPNKTACGVGQLINDGAALFFVHPTSWSRAVAAVAEYRDASSRLANVVANEERPMELWSSRYIDKEEELFISYGVPYWLELNSIRESNPSVALLAFMVDSSMRLAGEEAAALPPNFPAYNPSTRQFEVGGFAMDEEHAAHFIDFLGLKLDSPVWETLGVARASASVKLDALVAPLANNEDTLDVRYHEDDAGFVRD